MLTMGVPIVDYRTVSWVDERKARPAPVKETAPPRQRVLPKAAPQPAPIPAAQGRGRASHQPMDWVLFGVTVVLVGIGAVMVYSSSTVIAASKFDSATFFMVRQLARAGVGMLLLFVALRIPVENLQRHRLLLLAGACALLVVPHLLSVAYNGAKSWISFRGASFQPSELMKFALIVFLADRLASHQDRLASFANGLFPYLVVICIPLGLIVAEPDLGTAVATVLIVGVIMVAAHVRSRHLILLTATAGAATAFLIWLEPYRLKRLEAGYQVQQGFVALGSGGIFGRGLGKSFQKFFYLPEPFTDSIFPIIGEELGLIGTLGVLALFIVFGWRGLRIARQQATLFRFLLAVGLTANVMVYATLNIAVTTGLIPTTGLPLPFISYGGSALVLNLALTGILLNLSRQRRIDGPTYGLTGKPMTDKAYYVNPRAVGGGALSPGKIA